MLPAMKTTRTKASQPQNAFLRCRPLQCAIRAARLCFEDEVDMTAPDDCVRRRPLRKAPCAGQVLEPETHIARRGFERSDLPILHLAGGPSATCRNPAGD